MVSSTQYVGIGDRHIPSLTYGEASLLRVLWDSGTPLRAWDVYDALHITNRGVFPVSYSRSSVAVKLTDMVKRGFLVTTQGDVEEHHANRLLYYPSKSRETMVADFCDMVSIALSGKELTK